MYILETRQWHLIRKPRMSILFQTLICKILNLLTLGY